MSPPVLEVFDELPQLVDAALARILQIVRESIAARGRCTIALSGGSTPRALYQAWSTHTQLPWSALCFCFGDERAVPPNHADSNARMVHEALTGRAFVPTYTVHRIEAERGAADAAIAYEHTLRTLFPGEPSPRFDVNLMGLGADGHTASLFPHSAGLAERARWVIANEGPSGPRITLTYPVLNAARHTLFLVAGAEKSDALRRMLAPSGSVEETPARGIAPSDGTLEIFADRAVAGSVG